MRYASVCDGIGAAHVAWQPLGWECAWTSEIEPFPSAVVDERWKLKNVGDMTKLTEEQLQHEGPISLLVGGTPCQSFSVAGLRKGLEDPRGNLALRFTQLVGVLRPTWVVWENVPGVLSSAGGRDFGTFLGALAELGYGFAYRVLDAQWFGVAQRRRRVFVVAHARDWRCAAAVLFERESVFGNSPTRGAEGERVTSPIAGCSNGGGANGPGRTADDADSLVPVISPALKARDYKGPSSNGDGDGASLVPIAFKSNMSTPDAAVGLGTTLQAENFHAVAFTQNQREEVRELNDCATTLNLQGTHQQTYVATPFDTTQITSKANYSRPQPGDPCHPIAAGSHPPAVAFSERTRQHGSHLELESTDVTPAIRTGVNRQQGVIQAQAFTHSGYSNKPAWITGDRTDCLSSSGHGDTSHQGIGVMHAVAFTTEQTPKFNKDCALTITKQSPSGGGQPQCVMQPVIYDGYNQKANEDISPSVRIGRDSGDCVVTRVAACEVADTLSVGANQTTGFCGDAVASCEVSSSLRANPGSGWRSNGTPVEGVAIQGMAVRRLTPRECERLQGFPDDYTAITYRKKPAADGPRYKALGNSMAVPVMAWIGKRITEVEATDGTAQS
jgi:DNA (cytosine-5)-methyltransferase 1